MDLLVDPVDTYDCPHCGNDVDVRALQPFEVSTCPHCGENLRVPGRLGNFLLVEKLGQGGMAMVFKARDIMLKRYVAIKILNERLSHDPNFVKTFAQEAKAYASLNHPNVIQIYDFSIEHNQHMIVMELVEGETLKERIEDSDLTELEALEMTQQVARGLEAAQDAGLVHGDVSPGNIFINSKGIPKVGDFGLARFANVQIDLGTVWGTPNYIPPERVAKKHEDFRGDIYGLGSTIFHALAGRPPFVGETSKEVVRARLKHPAPNLNETACEIHPRTAALVARMLEMAPSKRHPTYDSLLADIDKALQEARTAPVESAPAIKTKGKLPLAAKLGIGVALLAMAVLTALTLLKGSGPEKARAPAPAGKAAPEPAVEVVFSEPFKNNRAGWTGIGNTAGKARLVADPAGPDSVWTGAGKPNGQTLVSDKKLASPLDPNKRPIELRARVRMQDIAGGEKNKFQLTLLKRGDGYIGLNVRPGLQARIVYSGAKGKSGTAVLGKLRFKDPKTYRTFVLRVTPKDKQLEIQGFIQSGEKLVTLGPPAVIPQTGDPIDHIRIAHRYGSPIYIDTVQLSLP